MFTPNYAYTDAAVKQQLGFQDPASPISEGIVRFHHELMVILTFIVIFVGQMQFRGLHHFDQKKNPVASQEVHGTAIEIIQTTVPGLILMAIAVPSFALLYASDEIIEPALTVKVIGHQQYQSYEYSDYVYQNSSEEESIMFDSYMLQEDDLEAGNFRLLEVDNRVVLPINTHVRFVITSADVLHCQALPSLGIKLDACPGRLNQVSTLITREGTYFGQCSEICGVNHAFMPIAVDAVTVDQYLIQIKSRLEELLFLT